MEFVWVSGSRSEALSKSEIAKGTKSLMPAHLMMTPAEKALFPHPTPSQGQLGEGQCYQLEMLENGRTCYLSGCRVLLHVLRPGLPAY